MLTLQEIQQIIEAQKQIFPMREEVGVNFESLGKQFCDLRIELDSYTEKASAYFSEICLNNNIR